MEQIIDYGNEFPDAIYAQGKGKLFIALFPNEDKTKRLDGVVAEYRVIQRDLSCECERPNDQAWACVQGSEISYWNADEFDKAYIDEGRGTLFDVFMVL